MANTPKLTGTVRYEGVSYRYDRPAEVESLFKKLEENKDRKAVERLIKKGLITGIEIPAETEEGEGDKGGPKAGGDKGGPQAPPQPPNK